ncbi:hypothetical protein DRQ25_06350 [Candidatus Fermentibacteria bacterium]|nr:MAG: hypothetical protein DRQ25_06350 [Candidatus Fermentibacteria bacterium]
MGILNLLTAALFLTAEVTLKDYAVTGFFGIASFLLFIFLQLLGAKLFVKITESGHIGPRVFVLVLLVLGLAGAVFSCFISNSEASLLLGFTSGLFIWSALCDVPEQMHWISPLSRNAVLFFLPLILLWAAGMLFLREIPPAVFGATGYPLGVWGIQLARARVISRWGPSSLAATILILLTAAIAGGALALGVVHGTLFSGIIGGVVFAIATWSALEIIWERGMAQKPWKNS